MSAFLGVFIGGAAVLLAVYGVALLVDPGETRHYEVAIPALMLGAFGVLIAFALWSVGKPAS
jgi:hypothetical protein